MIPATAHFIWFGPKLPYIYILGIRSAVLRGGFEQVVLHHSDDLSATPHWDSLVGLESFEARPLREEFLVEAHGELGDRLLTLFRELTAPAARANLMRAAILAHEGGVYLDTDTVTWRDVTPLRERAAVFCGEEHITLPSEVKNSGNPFKLGRAYWQNVVRDVYRRLPGGWRGFREYEKRMPRAVNNAVFACEPGHPFAMELLQRMVDMPEERKLVRFALGTHLLQQVVADYEGDDLEVHPPSVFYPLGPEVSQHWFTDGTAGDVDEMIQSDTFIIHWYASVRTKAIVPQLNPDSIRGWAETKALCKAALPFI